MPIAPAIRNAIKNKYGSRKERDFSMLVLAKDFYIPFSSVVPNPEIEIERQNELCLLCLCVGAECRNQPEEGIGLVTDVILNRACYPRGIYGSDVRSVILRHSKNGVYQFSCMNPKDPNYKWMRNPDLVSLAKISKIVVPRYFSPLQQQSRQITHYYNPSLCNPVWAKYMTLYKIVGNHNFLIESR